MIDGNGGLAVTNQDPRFLFPYLLDVLHAHGPIGQLDTVQRLMAGVRGGVEQQAGGRGRGGNVLELM